MESVHTCILCLGSNIQPALHLAEAETALNDVFPYIRWGKIVSTKAESTVEGSGDYLNRAALFDTSLTEKEVRDILKNIERANGRMPTDKARGQITLDIDLLQYGTEVLKPLDFKKEYVRKALEAFSG